MSITVTSPAFEAGQRIPVRYTQDGSNVSPPLQWSNLPAGTRELAIICEDPDAPRPEPYIHWLLYHIPADAGGLPEGIPQNPQPQTLPNLAQGENSANDLGYDGPAPPPGHGTHHYHFRVFALDRAVAAEPKLDNKALLATMAGHILDDGELVGTYERP